MGQALTRKWRLGKEGKFEGVRNMDVSESGEFIAVVEQIGNKFSTVLYSRANAQLWRHAYAGPYDADLRPTRVPLGVEYSERDGGVFVLATEWRTSLKAGVIIKYNADGTTAFTSTLVHRHYYPEVMEATSDGGVIVAGVDLDEVNRGTMIVEKFSGSGHREWSESYNFGGGITVPKRMRRIGSELYIAGIATVSPVSTGYEGYRLDRHPTSKMFTMQISLWDPTQEWHKFKDSPAGNYYAYDLEPQGTGVLVLGQSIVSGSGTPTGNTILVKYNHVGDEQWSITRPSNYRRYPDIDQNVLEAHRDDQIYIAYSPPSTADAAFSRIEKFDRSGNSLRTTDIRLDGPTEIQTLSINHANDELFVGLRTGRMASEYHTKIQSYSPEGVLISDGALSDDQSIRQLEFIDFPNASTYPTGTRTFYTCGDVGDRYCYIEKFEQTVVFAPFPYDWWLYDNFRSSRSGGDRWVIDYFCEINPCDDLLMTASGLSGGKEMWNQEFNKPTDLQLPSNLQIDSYVLKAKKDGVYHDLIRTDENLFVNGIKEFEIASDKKTNSLTLNVTTDGREVPFTVKWLNKDSKVIRTETFTAPMSKQLTEPMTEPVASIHVDAVSAPLQMSYYPNPSSGDFQVTLGDDVKLPAEVFVYDMTNTKVYQQSFDLNRQLPVKISGAKPGLYVLLVKSASGEQRELIQIK